MYSYLVLLSQELVLLKIITASTNQLVLLEEKNGNSCKLVAETTTIDAGTSTTSIPRPVTIEEKAKKKNDVKARSMLLTTGKKITINGNDIAGYDKSKVECFNCHKMGHFVREYRVPRNQENKTRNQETTKRTMNVEDTSSKVMVVIDGAGLDWSYIDDDEASTNMAFMDLLDSEVYTDNTCSKICLKNYATLKTQYDELRVESPKSKRTLADYKRGLASVEKQLVHYQTNESLLNENIVVSKRDIKIKDSKIVVLKSKLEKISNEKNALDVKIRKFSNASQSLDKLIGSQITNNSKSGLGYVSHNAIPPPHTRRFSPSRLTCPTLAYQSLLIQVLKAIELRLLKW
uniref:Uncharacterized protein n=1 Tax=Tanacetum cinerariifolium TaxID=118510 RepID=A0A6L2J7X9_TANCI|nr:hypothetical protein [Tanacetum cinerariifolium]